MQMNQIQIFLLLFGSQVVCAFLLLLAMSGQETRKE